MEQEKKAKAYLLDLNTHEIVGPVVYSYPPGTSFIIDYARLFAEQFPDSPGVEVVESLDIAESSFHLKGIEVGFLRTRFRANERSDRCFITLWDMIDKERNRSHQTLYSLTCFQAILLHNTIVTQQASIFNLNI